MLNFYKHYFSCTQVTALAHGPLHAALSRIEVSMISSQCKWYSESSYKFVKLLLFKIWAFLQLCTLYNSLTYNEKWNTTQLRTCSGEYFVLGLVPAFLHKSDSGICNIRKSNVDTSEHKRNNSNEKIKCLIWSPYCKVKFNTLPNGWVKACTY